MAQSKQQEAELLLLDSMEMATRYNVSYGTFVQWQRFQGFPTDAKYKSGHHTFWDAELVDRWLDARPQHERQRPTRWRHLVQDYVKQWNKGIQAVALSNTSKFDEAAA